MTTYITNWLGLINPDVGTDRFVCIDAKQHDHVNLSHYRKNIRKYIVINGKQVILSNFK